MNTGSIIDLYDDPEGHVLKNKLEVQQIPEFIKVARYLSDETRQKLPDDAYALVMVDQGEKLRKYACVDEGNTALSVIYFMENRHKLPEEAQKVAAANLVQHCELYNLIPPAPLLKLAGFWGDWKQMGETFKSGRNLKRMAKSIVKKEMKGKPGMYARYIAQGVLPKAAIGAAALKGAHELGKRKGRKEKTKTASPYVDITGQSAPVRVVEPTSKQYCLVKEGVGKFPIDSYGEVMDAQQWFSNHGETLHPEERREFCIKLAERAEALAVPLTDHIRKYAGTKYASDGDIKMAISTRMQFWDDDSPERDMLKGLMSKHASVQPDVFCEALRQFDEATGMHHYWDDAIFDPWYTTYGMDKKAEWSFSTHGDRINEEQLKQVVNAGFAYIKEKFGEELAVELRRKPIDIFKSLPLDAKRVIMRFALDPQPSPVVVGG